MPPMTITLNSKKIHRRKKFFIEILLRRPAEASFARAMVRRENPKTKLLYGESGFMSTFLRVGSDSVTVVRGNAP
jgi:hypothetical protein